MFLQILVATSAGFSAIQFFFKSFVGQAQKMSFYWDGNNASFEHLSTVGVERDSTAFWDVERILSSFLNSHWVEGLFIKILLLDLKNGKFYYQKN